jgi:predicted transcriptional regulator
VAQWPGDVRVQYREAHPSHFAAIRRGEEAADEARLAPHEKVEPRSAEGTTIGESPFLIV